MTATAAARLFSVGSEYTCKPSPQAMVPQNAEPTVKENAAALKFSPLKKVTSLAEPFFLNRSVFSIICCVESFQSDTMAICYATLNTTAII